MISEKLLGEDLLYMLQGKGKICISIIVPSHRLSPDRRVDKLEVERAIAKAKELIKYRYTESNTDPLLQSMDELYKDIDFTHNADGLGLYVSPDIKLAVQYPFPVKEKVMVGDNFEVRDLLYKVNYSGPYFVLLLTEKGARFFEGEWSLLKEIKDKNFPKQYTEEYIYNPPSRSTSYAGHAHVKSFEKDKSILEEIRLKDFFRYTDELLNDYLVGNIPLVLLGTEREMALFDKISSHKKHIINKVGGSYNYSNKKQLADIAWPAVYSYLQNERVLIIKEFTEKIGEHHAVSGIEEVWRAAREGKGLKLLVEKDFRSPGFVSGEAYHLYLHPPKAAHRALADAVDDIIEMVLEKKGKVFFTDNGMLKDFQCIALITRY
jgi:Bacterial archaeo-eukaryotic release factor family 3